MNLGTDINKIKRDLSHLRAGNIFFNFLFFRAKSLLFIVSLGIFSYCVYIWYDAIYTAEWNEEQKKNYINNKEKGVIFNEAGFKVVIEDTTEREAASHKFLENRVDIFRLKNTSKKQED